MTDYGQQGSNYTMGYSEEFRQLLDRRSLRTHAAHLVPYLESGLRVLDFGCGPGTISVGLAQAVEPGEVHGVDIEESQIELARAAAEAGGHSNATFHVGSVTDLPFEDGYFDAAHCHAVLMHVPDTEAVLSEVKRVLKPGGIIACRETIVASSFAEPSNDELRSGWTVFGNLITANGGHPQMGWELKDRFVSAGFTDVRVSASFEVFSTPDDVTFLHGFIMDWFFMPYVIEAATSYGLATHQQFDRWRASLEEWRSHAGAVGAIAFGEAVGTKP